MTPALAPPRRSAPAPAGRSLAPAAGEAQRLRAHLAAAGDRRGSGRALARPLWVALGPALALALVASPAAAAPAGDHAASAGSPVPADSDAAGPAASASSPVPADSEAADPTSESAAPAESPVPADSGAEPPAEGPAAPAASPVPADSSPAKPSGGEKPPRVDGVYVGGTLGGGVSFARVNNFPTPDPFAGGGGTLRVGEVLYRWLSIGVEIAGNFAYRPAEPRQRLLQGAFLVDFGFYPAKRLPLSLRAGFGAGGGAVRERGRAERSGFGGAVFTGAVRYEFFPGAERRRPRRGGGFSLGPELGWIGFMPAAKGRPMSHTVYLGLFLGFYFGS